MKKAIEYKIHDILNKPEKKKSEKKSGEYIKIYQNY